MHPGHGRGIDGEREVPVVATAKAQLAVPREVVTVREPVVAPMGTVVVIAVVVMVRRTAATPLMATRVAPGSNRAPVIVTYVPTGPLAGSTAVIAAPRATLKL